MSSSSTPRAGRARFTTTALVTTSAVVVNRALPALGVELEDIERLDDGPAKEAALLHTALYEEQLRWLRSLPDGPQIPYLFGLHTPPEVAERIADLWRDA